MNDDTHPNVTALPVRKQPPFLVALSDEEATLLHQWTDGDDEIGVGWMSRPDATIAALDPETLHVLLPKALGSTLGSAFGSSKRDVGPSFFAKLEAAASTALAEAA